MTLWQAIICFAIFGELVIITLIEMTRFAYEEPQ